MTNYHNGATTDFPARNRWWLGTVAEEGFLSVM